MKGNRAQPDQAIPKVMHTRDLVGRTEIALRLCWSKNTVCNWSARETDDFPKPVAWLAMGQLFDWNEVEAWAARTGRLSLTDEQVRALEAVA